MDNIFTGVFSEYTVTGVAFKPKDANSYTLVDGAGSAEEVFDRKNVTKAKSNVVVKKISRSAGTGKVTFTLHMPVILYNEIQGILKGSAGGVVAGVSAYGGKAKCPPTEIAVQVEDEDGDKKFKYYPCATSASFNRSTTSEEDSVAEVTMEFDLSTDIYGQLMYEALATELDAAAGTITSANWMSAVSSAALQASGTTGTTGTTGQG